jgi:hypothetical protein
LVVGPDRFGDLVFVFFDDAVGCFYDIFGAAVILLEFVECKIRVIFSEVKDVFDVRTPKRVYALGVVANNTNVFICFCKLFDDKIL